jgi:hypothetical protein
MFAGRLFVVTLCLCLLVGSEAGRTIHGLPQRPEDLLHAAVRDGTDLELIQVRCVCLRASQ